MEGERGLLEPVATWVRVLLALVGTLAGIGVIAMVFGSGSVFGIGASEVCVETANGHVPVPQSGNNVATGVEDGVRSWPSAVGMCAQSPTTGQRLLGVLSQAPTFGVFVGTLLLAIRLLRGASRDGIFTLRVAGRLRTLGWFVLVGEAVATLVEALASNWLTSTMMVDRHDLFSINEWDVPVMALLAGAGLVSMARIMRAGATMREDLEGTV
ncbi:DUF2975 domain-containing protein [Saccharomonospora piscinae]|uniref:DUF2975 domain-containing protein n=1 Tax=Saccharomonospora piscinae TaxID=687388 RepID=UPI0004667997|nr:DUF2975 domain-containing protein [Saccharomonospora piscinae]